MMFWIDDVSFCPHTTSWFANETIAFCTLEREKKAFLNQAFEIWLWMEKFKIQRHHVPEMLFNLFFASPVPDKVSGGERCLNEQRTSNVE